MVNAADQTAEKIKKLAFNQGELDELKRARSAPIVFDEDGPEITSERAIKFRRVNPLRRVAN